MFQNVSWKFQIHDKITENMVKFSRTAGMQRKNIFGKSNLLTFLKIARFNPSEALTIFGLYYFVGINIWKLEPIRAVPNEIYAI